MREYSHLLNEIMPMIYKRFTDKAAEEWRQIYKVLRSLALVSKTISKLTDAFNEPFG